MISDEVNACANCVIRHAWAAALQFLQFAKGETGEWTYETEAASEPSKPATKATGTESVRSLGGLWVLAEGRGEMPGGGPAMTLTTLGYDTDRKRYVGTWVGSMMTFMWIYDGELDATGRVLTLSSDGPTMAGDGKMTKYKDIIEFKSDDHRILTARVLAPDSAWQQLMRVDYHRRKNAETHNRARFGSAYAGPAKAGHYVCVSTSPKKSVRGTIEALRMENDHDSPQAIGTQRGLCGSCVHSRIVGSSKGASFVLCRLSYADPTFDRYPRLPVVACKGYVPAVADTSGGR